MHPSISKTSSLVVKSLAGAALIVGMAAPALLASDPVPQNGNGNGAVAISSKVSPDYSRTLRADGTFAPETITFGKGGVWGGAERDATMDKLTFLDVARVVSGPLARQDFISDNNPRSTKILVMVYWGATQAPEHATDSVSSENLMAANAAALAANHAQMAHFSANDACAPSAQAESNATSYAIRSPGQIDQDNAMTGAMAVVAAEDRSRDDLDARNAAMLGYDGAWDEAAAYKATPLEFRRNELVNELEESRYFVVLMAYDFQLMWKQHKTKLLWETRYSIRERGNDFEKELEEMSRQASAYFGRPSGGLIRSDLPIGHVEIGAGKVLALGH